MLVGWLVVVDVSVVDIGSLLCVVADVGVVVVVVVVVCCLWYCCSKRGCRCCLLFVVCCVLCVVCCVLCAVCCLLFVVCCVLFVWCCELTALGVYCTAVYYSIFSICIHLYSTSINAVFVHIYIDSVLWVGSVYI